MPQKHEVIADYFADKEKSLATLLAIGVNWGFISEMDVLAIYSAINFGAKKMGKDTDSLAQYGTGPIGALEELEIQLRR